MTDPTNPFQDRGEVQRALGKYCAACLAVPKHGYCQLAGCPTAPGADTPMDFDASFDRLVMWAMAYAAELEEEGAAGIIDGINRDVQFLQQELDWSAAMSDAVASGGLFERGCYVPRPDLALGALQVAVKTDQIDVATCFAQTAIDFLTGNYDPENFDVDSPTPHTEGGET